MLASAAVTRPLAAGQFLRFILTIIKYFHFANPVPVAGPVAKLPRGRIPKARPSNMNTTPETG